ncbi:UDP-glucosyltransferase 2 [Drosophila montana]|uniref:UDP-glucosyltransferase 2 n=1 Tax=Drosophila montana TaxID=40370 RepID=UPI00313BACF0
MKTLAALLLLLFCHKWQQLNAASILCLVGTAQHNNPGWTKPFFEALAGRGHSLTVIGTQGDLGLPHIRQIFLPNEHDVVKKHYTNDMGHYQQHWDIKQLLIWYEALLGGCRSIIETNFFKTFDTEALKYDLIIYDATFSMDCLLTTLPRYRSVPVLGLSGGKLTTDLIDLVQGEDTISAATIPHFISRLPITISYWQRIQNHVMYLAESFIHWAVVQPVLNGMLESGFSSTKAHVVLLNTHPVLDYVQNMPPNVIEVGGLHIRAESEPLPFSLQEFIERFSEGIVYINLPHIELMYGLGLKAIESMIKEFSQLGFLWNVNNLKDLQLSESLYNLRTISVVDNMQQNILAQSNVKAFLTHGDSFGIQEAIYNAVPIIVLPLLMDQMNNGERVQERYLGVRISAKNFSVDSFSAALKKIIREEIYVDELQQAQLVFRTRQAKPVDLAIWYAEQLVSQPYIFKQLWVPESSQRSYFVRKSLDVLSLPFFFFLFFFANVVLAILQSIVSDNEKKKAKQVKKLNGIGKELSPDKEQKED